MTPEHFANHYEFEISAASPQRPVRHSRGEVHPNATGSSLRVIIGSGFELESLSRCPEPGPCSGRKLPPQPVHLLAPHQRRRNGGLQ
mgnify:CR=1 FL=1